MSVAMGVAERLLALEAAVAELQKQLAVGGSGAVAEPPTSDNSLAQALGNVRLAGVLARAGYTTPEAVVAAPDAALLAIDGVSERGLKLIREKL